MNRPTIDFSFPGKCFVWCSERISIEIGDICNMLFSVTICSVMYSNSIGYFSSLLIGPNQSFNPIG